LCFELNFKDGNTLSLRDAPLKKGGFNSPPTPLYKEGRNPSRPSFYKGRRNNFPFDKILAASNYPLNKFPLLFPLL